MIIHSIIHNKAWLGVALALILFQCKTARNTSGERNSQIPENEHEPEIYSANTKMFLQDLGKEMEVQLSRQRI